MTKTSKALLFVAALVLLAFFVMIGSFFQFLSSVSENVSITEDISKKPHLTLLKLDGPIFSAEGTLSSIRRIREDEHCQGVMVRIESPGGAVGASQEIYHALRELRKSGKPVIVSQANIAASGGYYVSLAGEKIFANPGTLTGSIGVIFQFPEAERLFDKVGISLQTVKSGALKDVGNFARKPTAPELAYLQNVIDDTYDQFFSDILVERPISSDSLKTVADGRVLTGRQAQKMGLIDTLGGFEDAKRYLASKTGVDFNQAMWVEPPPKKWFESLAEEPGLTGSRGMDAALKEWIPRLKPGLFSLWTQP